MSASEDTLNEEKLGSEDGSCVKGYRMRKPVPPPVDAEDLWLAEVRGKLMKVKLGGVQCASSVVVVVDLIQVSVRQKSEGDVFQ